MTPQKILADGNKEVQKRTILAENATQNAYAAILTPEEMEASRYVNAEFYTAAVQVPNDYVVVAKDALGNDVREAAYDHSNPKFQDFDMVRVRSFDSASGITTEVDHYVTPFHIARWPERWKAYKAGQSVNVEGVAIDQLSAIPEAARLKLKEAGVFTVEQLAKLSNPGSVIMNGVAYQGVARKFLTEQGHSKTEQLEVELAELKAQMAELLKVTKTK